MAYSISSSDSNCYPGTTVLINKLGLKNQELLDRAEELAVSVSYAQIYNSIGSEPFTFAFYKSLHRKLFHRLYGWAGELRTINLSKKGTLFYPADELEMIGTAMFERLEAADEFCNLSHDRFVTEITGFYHDLNMLHPFREGNGRTQRLFFTLLIERAGYHIDFSAYDPDELMMATIFAAQGIMDQLHSYFEKAIQS